MKEVFNVEVRKTAEIVKKIEQSKKEPVAEKLGKLSELTFSKVGGSDASPVKRHP